MESEKFMCAVGANIYRALRAHINFPLNIFHLTLKKP